MQLAHNPTLASLFITQPFSQGVTLTIDWTTSHAIIGTVMILLNISH
jgi:hypothetical protein